MKLKRIRKLGIVENDFIVFRFTLWEIWNIE